MCFLRLVAVSLLCFLISTRPTVAQIEDATSAPPASSFATQGDVTGALANSVNLFSGEVTLPLPLVSLSGRNGLDVAVSAVYNGNIEYTVERGSREGPTGVLGLGWNLDFGKIVVDHKGTGTYHDDEYYLVEGGSTLPLIRTGTTAHGTYIYATENYQFWRIYYYPTDERWEITKENGITSVFGGKSDDDDNVQWGVKWGNWIGNSTRSGGQRFALVWNLSKTRSAVGGEVSFEYDAYRQNVGTGPAHTSASYLASITDVFGRTVEFSYADKDAVEYEDLHQEMSEQAPSLSPSGSGDAYQERYETKFLDYIEVKSEHGNKLYELQFNYYNELYGAADGRPKRQLESVEHVNKDGDSLPPIEFVYASGANPGGLSKVTTPGGAQVHYTHEGMTLGDSDRDLDISAPSGYSDPRVFIAEDYVVVTWYDADNDNLKVFAYQWDGEWIEAEMPGEMTGVNLLNDRYQEAEVQVQGDFFAVRTRSKINLYHKDTATRGAWTSHSYGIEHYSEGDFDYNSLVTGRRFAAVAEKDDGQIHRFVWSGDRWVVDTIGASLPNVMGAENYYVYWDIDILAGTYDIKIDFIDETGEWQSNTLAASPSPTWDTPWAAASTFIAIANEDVGAYVHQWDENYSNLSSIDVGNINIESSPFIVGNSLVQMGVGNGGGFYLLRYDGYEWDVINPAYELYTTVGEDFFSKSTGFDDAGYTYDYNPNRLVGGSFDPDWLSRQTIGEDHTDGDGNRPGAGRGTFNLGQDLFTRSVSGNWDYIESLTGSMSNYAVKHVRSNLLAYQTYGATTHLVEHRNGDFLNTASISGRRFIHHHIAVGPLAGGNTIVTYDDAINPDNFKDVASLRLHRYADGGVTGSITRPVVTKIRVYDGHDWFDTHYAYDTSTALVDRTGYRARFGKVTVTPGPTAEKLAGHTEHRFYVGAKVIDGVTCDPPHWSLMQGQSCSVRGYDNNGYLRSSETTAWTIAGKRVGVRSGTDRDLVHYVRPLSTTVQQGGITRTSTYGYDADTGLRTSVSGSSYDASGNEDNFTEDITYAADVYADLQDLHLLTPVAARTKTVNGEVTHASATTWWDGWSTFDSWAPRCSYVWKGAGSSEFTTWTGGSGNSAHCQSKAAWLKSSRITQRDVYGNATESYDFLTEESAAAKWSDNGGLRVAAFANATDTDTRADNFDDLGLTDGAPAQWQINGPNHWTTSQADLRWQNDTEHGGVMLSEGVTQQAFIAEFVLHPELRHWHWLGFHFRAMAASHSVWTSGYTLYLRGDGRLELHDFANTRTLAATTLDRGVDPVRIRVVVDGDHIRVYADDTQAIDVTDSSNPYANGQYAGFYSEAMPGRIDDFRLYPLEAEARSMSYDPDFRRLQSQTGADGRPSYREYDPFGRLVETRRYDGRVVAEQSQYEPRRFDDGNIRRLSTYMKSYSHANPIQNGGFELGEWDAARPLGWRIWSEADAGSITVEAGERNASNTGSHGMRMTPDGTGSLYATNQLYDAGFFERDTEYTVTFYAENLTEQATELTVQLSDIIDNDAGGVSVQAPVQLQAACCWRRYSVTLRTSDVPDWGDPAKNRGWLRLGLSASAAPVLIDDVQIVKGTGTAFPAMTATYIDAVGRVRQTQQQHLGTTLDSLTIQQTFYDAVGRADVVTKPARMPGITLWYRGAFASLDRNTWGVSGAVADAYPEDGGYPYSRTVFEKSSSGRPVEQGGPGTAYRVGGGHSTSIWYGDGVPYYLQSELDLPVDEYRFEEVTDPDGNSSTSLSDASGNMVATLGPQRRASLATYHTVTAILEKPQTSFHADYAQDVAYEIVVNNKGAEGFFFYVGTSAGASDVFAINEDWAIEAEGTGSISVAAGTYYITIGGLPGGDAREEPTDDDPPPAPPVEVNVTYESAQTGTFRPLTSYEYDDYGRVVAIYPPNYHDKPATSGRPEEYVTTRSYDHFGRLLEEQTPDAGTERFLYDAAGRLRFAVDSVGMRIVRVSLPDEDPPPPHVVRYLKYDDQDRVIEEGLVQTDWDGLEAHVNDASWPLESDSWRTWRRKYVYADDFRAPHVRGQLLQVLSSSDSDDDAEVEETFTYDLDGNVSSVVLLVPEVSATPIAVDYEYDDTGAPVRVTAPGGEVVYGYDPVGRVTSIGITGAPERFAAYSYAPSGAVREALFDDSYLSRTHAFDGQGRLTRIDYETGGSALFREDLSYETGEYDPYGHTSGFYNGRLARTSFQYSWSGAPSDYDVAYRYDAAGQLTGAEHTVGGASPGPPLSDHDLGIGSISTVGSMYDPNGNPQRHVHGGSGAGELLYAYYAGTNKVSNTDGSGSDYRYDGNGNTTYSRSLDPAGSTTISYDVFSGLPTRVNAPDGAGGRTTTRYHYTSDGERVLKTGEAGGYDTRTLYVRGLAAYPMWVSTCTDVGSGDGTPFWACDGTAYVRGPAGLLVETTLPYRRPDGSVDPNAGTGFGAGSGGGGGSTLEAVRYGVIDHLGSVRALLAEQGGGVEVWADYGPFGAQMRGGVYGVEGRYTYTGQEADAESGLLNYRARLYDAALGRFYARDPAGQFHSPYSYVGNNPASFTDPTGEFILEAMAIFAVANVVADGVQGNIDSWGDFGLSAASGALQGALAAGTGGVSTAGGALAAAASSHLPSVNVAGVGIRPSFAYGSSGFSIGLDVSRAVSIPGGFTIGVGGGASFISGGPTPGMFGFDVSSEVRTFGFLGYQNGNFRASYSLTTYGGMEPNQVVSSASLGYGDFWVRTDNDSWLGGNGDEYRTAAVEAGIGQFSAGFQLYTGLRTGRERIDGQLTYKEKNPYRQGLFYFGFGTQGGTYRVGVDSEPARAFVQNNWHTLISPILKREVPHFRKYSIPIRGYLEYGSRDPYSIY